jgi:hypothetical protein
MADKAQKSAQASGTKNEANGKSRIPGGHPENQEGAAKATEDNDLTTGHSRPGDGGDANSKQNK